MDSGTGGLDSLFDDAIVWQTMATIGVDEVTARYALALHRGTVTGDIEILGGQFRGVPLRPKLLEPVVSFDAAGIPVIASTTGTTASVITSNTPWRDLVPA